MRRDEFPLIDTYVKKEIVKVLEDIKTEAEAMITGVRPFDGMAAVIYTRGFNNGIGSVIDLIDKYINGKEKET